MTRDQARRTLSPAIADHILESRNVLYVVADSDGSVLFANPAVSTLLGGTLSDDVTLRLWEILPEAQVNQIQTMLEEGVDGTRTCAINFVRSGRDCMTFDCRIWMTDGRLAIVGEAREQNSEKLHRELMALNNEMVVKSRELTRQKRELEHARKELQDALDELEQSYWHLKKLQEVLPICMECGKVKTSEADWEDVVDYLQRNALFLSHGYCPDCAETMRERYGIPHEEGEDASEAV